MSDPPPGKPEEKKPFERAVDELLNSIVAQPVSSEREEVRQAERSTAEESAHLENQLKAADLLGKKQDISERKRYALFVFVLIAAWLGIVLVILFFAGFKSIWCGEFALSDNVLLALIGASTLNVIGLFTVVVKYLFPEKKQPGG